MGSVVEPVAFSGLVGDAKQVALPSTCIHASRMSHPLPSLVYRVSVTPLAVITPPPIDRNSRSLSNIPRTRERAQKPPPGRAAFVSVQFCTQFSWVLPVVNEQPNGSSEHVAFAGFDTGVHVIGPG